MATTNYTFTTPSNYTASNDSLIGVSGGNGTLLDISPTNSTCAAMWDNDVNFTWADGTTTATATGTPTISSGYLDLDSGDYLTFDADSNADFQQTITVRFRIKTDYTGNPGTTKRIFVISEEAGSTNNELSIYQLTNGNLTLLIRDSTGGVITATNFGAWSPSAGVPEWHQLCMDITSGATRYFINGTQVGTTKTSTGTRSSDIALLRIGADVNGATANGEFQLNNFVVFNSVTHTANHAGEIPYADPIKYSKADPTLTVNSTFKATDLSSFTETSTSSGSDAIRHVIRINGTDKYWNGSSWVTSDGTYSQANSAADINTNIASLLVNTRATVGVKSFLHSEYGGTTPLLDLITIVYDEALGDATPATLVDLEGFLYDNDGPIVSEDVEIRPFEGGFLINNILHAYVWRTLDTTDSDGFFSGSVYIQPSGKFWELKVANKRYKIALPDQAEVGLGDLTTFEVIEIET